MKLDTLELFWSDEVKPLASQIQVISLLDLFIRKYGISQRSALQLLSHLQQELNWQVAMPSQATLTRKLKGVEQALDIDTTAIFFTKDNVQTQSGIDEKKAPSMHQITLWITVTPTDINVDFEAPPQRKQVNTKLKELTHWMDEKADFVNAMSQFLAVKSNKLYELLIPLYPRRKRVKDEWVEDILDEYRLLPQRNTIEEHIDNQITKLKQAPTIVDSEYFNVMIINAQYESIDDGLEQLEIVLLKCKRTSMVLAGILNSAYRLVTLQEISLKVKKKKHLHLSLHEDEHGYPINYLARFHFNGEDAVHQKVPSFASEFQGKDALCLAQNINAKASAITLTLDKSIDSRIAASKHISQWIRWLNFRNAALNNSDVDFYFGFSSDVKTYGGDSKFTSIINELI